MATIYDLPLETIGRIINIAYPIAPIGTGRDGLRTQFLLAVALVCRAWTPFAQQGLWLDVRLDGSSIPQFIAAVPGRHPVQKLELLLVGSAPQQTEGILRDVRGVRDLLLSSGHIRGDWLCGENLKDLKSLSLYCTVLATAPVTSTFRFHLYAFAIAYRDQPSSFQLLDALSRQSSIESLSVSAYKFNPTRIMEHLAPLAPRLVTLKVMFDYLGVRAANDFLKLCTQLKHLASDSLFIDPIHHVVVPLASWTLINADMHHVATVLYALNSDCIAVSKLRKLTLRAWSSVELRTARRWSELQKWCRENKIELIIFNSQGIRLEGRV